MTQSPNSTTRRSRLATALLGAGLACVATGPTLAADTTTSIERNSDSARALADERSYTTREERLSAQPLDWRVTSGKPKRGTTAAGATSKPPRKSGASAPGGSPDTRAIDEARRLYPDEWRR